jgi:hypothetical protein
MIFLNIDFTKQKLIHRDQGNAGDKKRKIPVIPFNPVKYTFFKPREHLHPKCICATANLSELLNYFGQ